MQVSPARPAAALLLTALLAGPASAITLDASFDHGALASYSVTGDFVNLVGRDNFYGGGQWRWVYFRADDVLGQTPTFRINTNFAGGADRITTHPMVYSYDGEDWSFFDSSGRVGNSRVGEWLQFNNARPFTQDRVYVAYAPPYSYGDSVAHAQQVLASPWAIPTASGDSNGVIGRSPGGVDDLGRTIAPRDIYAYRITNPATTRAGRDKPVVVLTTGMHAGETLGTHMFAATIDWLISDDPYAAAVRDAVEVLAYPTMNPDGRFAGYNRSTVENPDRDPNGFWNPSRWIGHEDIQVNGEAMIADTAALAGAVDLFMDYHSTIPAAQGDDFGFIEVDQGDHLSDFWQAFTTLQPNVVTWDSTGTSWTSANFAEAFLGARVDITFETMFGFRRDLSHYETMGRNVGMALYEAYADRLVIPEPAAALALIGGVALRRRRPTRAAFTLSA